MTRQLITHPSPHPTRRQLRNAAIAATATVIAIAAGGYGAIQTLGPDADAPQSATRPATAGVVPKTQAMQEMRDAIAGQYGTHPATNETSRAQAMREMRDTVANLYGPATSTAPVSRARAMREMRDTVANLYGDGR
jgi:hypothetical protein